MARLFLLLALVSSLVLGQPNNPNCVKTFNGKNFDFNQLGRSTDYTFGDGDQGKYTFYTNLCQAIVSSPCTPGTALCQTWSGNGVASLGQYNTMQITAPEKGAGGINDWGAKFSFTGGLQGREFELDLKCDPNVMSQGTPSFVDENPPLHYNFEWRSIFACPLDFIKKEEGQGNKGLSPGSVMLIILLCLVVVYLVGGILFNKFYKKENGLDIIPNKGIWFAIPGLVKDGFMFVTNKVLRRGNNAYSKL